MLGAKNNWTPLTSPVQRGGKKSVFKVSSCIAPQKKVSHIGLGWQV